MKNILMLLVFAGLLSACKKDKDDLPPAPPPTNPPMDTTLTDPPVDSTSNIHLRISSFFGDQELEFGETYFNILGYRFNVADFKLYLSYIYFIEQNGDTAHLADIAFFNLYAGDNELIIEDVPVGNYAQMGFGIGVAPDMNSPQNPDFDLALFDNDHPLSQFNGMYWTWQGGYRFVIFEGKYDTDPDSTEPMVDGYSFHTGGDESYRVVNLTGINFNVSANENTVAHLDFAVDRFFYSETDTIDIDENPMTHSPNTELSARMSDHIQQAVSFRP